MLCAYHRVVVAPDDFRIEPGTLIASNHQRDADGPLLGTVLVRRQGLRFRCPLPYFATREDLFRPGILSRLTVRWPAPLPGLLGRISLAWFFPLGRAEPIRRVREFTLGEALRALQEEGLGGAACASLLNPRGRRELGVDADARLNDAIATAPASTLEYWWGLRRLNRAGRQRVAPSFRATVDAQLANFADRLDHGRSVYFAPEGTISLDGHFSRIRGGCHRLVRLAGSAPLILPVALGYDTLGPGRPRVVVRIGTGFRADPGEARRAFDARLRDAILALAPITTSHLLARFLLRGPAVFTQDELIDWLVRARDHLRGAQRSLDPLFIQRNFMGVARERIRWLEGNGLLVRRGAAFHNACPRDADPGWRAPANVVRYHDNTLADLAQAGVRLPPCRN
jgi:1-acyl-sn-glycerol-3-phosphate acyltransferase